MTGAVGCRGGHPDRGAVEVHAVPPHRHRFHAHPAGEVIVLRLTVGPMLQPLPNV